MTATNPARLRVSVAMCTFNGERYLQEQLESICLQQLPVMELVICDDGSVDGTEKIVQQFAKRVSFPVLFHKNAERLGSSRNFAQAISLCSGDLIALADQDDIWFRNKTQQMVTVFEQEPEIGGVFTDAVVVDETSMPTGQMLWAKYGFSRKERSLLAAGEYVPVLLRRPVVTGATFMFRSSLRSSVLPIPSPWIHDAWLSWSIAMHSRLMPLEKPLMAYRAHASQQIGVPPGMMSHMRKLQTVIREGSRTLSGSRARALREYENHVCELHGLLSTMDRSGLQNAGALRSVSGKAAFYEDILRSFGNARGLRLWFWLKHLPQYQRFSLMGWRTGLRDALL